MNQGKISLVAAVAVIVIAAAAILGLPLLKPVSDCDGYQPEKRCLSHLDQLAKAAMIYRIDFGGYPPWRNPDFFTAIYTNVLREEMCYRCPSSPEDVASAEQFRVNDPRVTDYECRNHPPDEKCSPALIIWEKKPFHEQGRNVVLGYFTPAQGKWSGGWNMKRQFLFPEEKFQELLKEARK